MPPKRPVPRALDSMVPTARGTGSPRSGSPRGSASPRGEVSLDQQLADLAARGEEADRRRCHFQLERDQVERLWAIAEGEVEALRVECRLKDRDLEEQEERHQVELQVYEQKRRHLQYEHELECRRVREGAEDGAAALAEGHRDRVAGLAHGSGRLLSERQTLQRAHEEAVEARTQAHQRLLSIRRGEADRALREMADRHDKKLRAVRADLDLRQRVEVHEVEERKNEHLKGLRERHDAAFADMKEYYNDITGRNLALIRELREELAAMKRNAVASEQRMAEIAEENKRLGEPLGKATKELDALKVEMAGSEADRRARAHSEARLRGLHRRHRSLERDHRLLQETHDQVAAECAQLRASFPEGVRAVHATVRATGAPAAARADALAADLAALTTHLSTITSADPKGRSSLPPLPQKPHPALAARNRAAQALVVQVLQEEALYHDTLKAYEARCLAAGIPPLDLADSPPQKPLTPLTDCR